MNEHSRIEKDTISDVSVADTIDPFSLDNLIDSALRERDADVMS